MGKKIDLTGQRFGKLVVLREVGSKNGRVLWECLCDCGKHTNVVSNNLTRGNTKSCGCMTTKIDLTGQRFGAWTVLGDSGKRVANRQVLYTCICECGNKKDVDSYSLKSGRSNSCGCLYVKNLVGQRFGELVVLGDSGERDSGGAVMWNCVCDCGNQTTRRSSSLKSGRSSSCGCLKYDDLTGKRFGKLVVLNEAEKIGMPGKSRWRSRWNCLCDCGKQTTVFSTSLKSGNTKSCGCFRLAILRSKVGNKSSRYNQNLTDEERLSRRYQLGGNNVQKWSQQIMKRDNYTCQICSDNKGGNLNAHHLNGWNAFPEQRFDLHNGVTLCEDCHKDFHSEYGYGDNTREQFDEYAASKTLVLN